jgi:hypothetical protein
MQSMTDSMPTERSQIGERNLRDKTQFLIPSVNISMESPGTIKCPPITNFGVLNNQQLQNEKMRHDRRKGNQFVRNSGAKLSHSLAPKSSRESKISPRGMGIQDYLGPLNMQSIESREIVKMRPHMPAYQIFGIPSNQASGSGFIREGNAAGDSIDEYD